jgi:hypothetical protein
MLSSVGGDGFNCRNSSDALVCMLASLASGQRAVISVNAAAPRAGMYTSTDRVSGGGLDPSGINNSSELTTTVMAMAAPPSAPPQPAPAPTPAPARRGGGGGSMDLALLCMLLLVLSRVAMLRRRGS